MLVVAEWEEIAGARNVSWMCGNGRELKQLLFIVESVINNSVNKIKKQTKITKKAHLSLVFGLKFHDISSIC